ncbi:MAG TPA: CDP-diacylglycerol--glycerol-3-phosphate 3-phosphatidyltransferase [Actinomycetales bacterium]|nr:CDP-diacylglycerol--glycerol-3-phosphate 3-phosphatidyltransferase [Actinomycetales bacterium]
MKAERDPIADPAVAPSAWNIANALTLVRIAMVPVFALLLVHDHGTDPLWRVLATATFAIAVVTDRVDGEIARKRGLVTDFGKVADPIADKALMGTALVALSALGELPWWVTVVVLVREIGITVLRFVVIRHGVIPASHGGKLKTVLQALAIGLYLLPLKDWFGDWAGAVQWWVMLAAVAVTVVTGLDYIVQAVRLRRTSERTLAKRAGNA